MIVGVPQPAGRACAQVPDPRLRGWTVPKNVSKSNRSLWLVAGLSGVFAPAGATEPCYYPWIQLPSAGGLAVHGQAINDLGWVTGFASNGGDNDRSFIWRPDTGTSVLIPLPP